MTNPLRDCLIRMRERDERNGSLPPWFRDQIDTALAAKPETVECVLSIDASVAKLDMERIREWHSATYPSDENVERVARAFEPKLWERIDRDIAGTHMAGAAQFAKSSAMDRARAAIIALRGGE